ncbi:Aldo/keto reductase [Chaetoceros tenuissimus]|uniref:Aldo/keto reductase n=1 Tax=Chaetoceros tenuissimus TaxID=426638 RepID=A0AAD3CNY3_9STRA|nr:Aldo/keto reductase [Chaetoceros tenuissimus]
MVLWTLVDTAKEAVAQAKEDHKTDSPIVDPNTNNSTDNKISIAVAKQFLSETCPYFLTSKAGQDEDRLVKVGRSIADLIEISTDDTIRSALETIVDQCDVLGKGNLKVPKVRFGKTEIQMPIVTLGCMRFQQTWAPTITNLKVGDNVLQECQDNLYEILKYSVQELGINHIETANMYGSSEIQLGEVFERLFKPESGIKREDVIIQTKVNCFDAETFRKTLEDSFSKLKLDYIDLFSFHGVNYYKQYDLMFNNQDGENLMDIAKEYQAKGKIRHVGFSSHAQPELIAKCIKSDAFSYANIHLHAFGSYTASGGGMEGGNLECARLMKERDMGIFIISPYDKGGRLYAPSKKLRSLTLPEFEPINYGSLYLFHHESLDEQSCPAHTIVCGAARPSDLDEPAYAAHLFAARKEETLAKVKSVKDRLNQAMVDTHGEEWAKTWHHGLPNCNGDDKIDPIGQLVWLYNIIKAYGMWEFAKDRYGTFDSNFKGWDSTLSNEENIQKKYIMWGYMPGVAYDGGKDYSEVLKDVPDQNKEKVLDAMKFVHKFCSNTVTEKGEIPDEWTTAFDMRPWTAFPERK